MQELLLIGCLSARGSERVGERPCVTTPLSLQMVPISLKFHYIHLAQITTKNFVKKSKKIS